MDSLFSGCLTVLRSVIQKYGFLRVKMVASEQGFVNFRFRFDLLHLTGEHCSVYIFKKRKFILRSLQCVSCIIGKNINMISFIFSDISPRFPHNLFSQLSRQNGALPPGYPFRTPVQLFYHLIYIILLSLAASVSLIPGIALKYHFRNFITRSSFGKPNCPDRSPSHILQEPVQRQK